MSSLTDPMTSHSSLIHVLPLDRKEVATRTVEVEIGAISHKLSMEIIIQGPIVYFLSAFEDIIYY